MRIPDVMYSLHWGDGGVLHIAVSSASGVQVNQEGFKSGGGDCVECAV